MRMRRDFFCAIVAQANFQIFENQALGDASSEKCRVRGQKCCVYVAWMSRLCRVDVASMSRRCCVGGLLGRLAVRSGERGFHLAANFDRVVVGIIGNVGPADLAAFGNVAF